MTVQMHDSTPYSEVRAKAFACQGWSPIAILRDFFRDDGCASRTASLNVVWQP